MSKNELSLENKTLEELERIVNELWEKYSEEFFQLGTTLLLIKEGKWEESDCKNWTEYCNSGRLAMQRQPADRQIDAAIIRPYLPNFPKVKDAPDRCMWTEWSVRPFVKAWKKGEYEVREFKALARDVVKDFNKSQKSDKPEALSTIATRWVDRELGIDRSAAKLSRDQKHIEYLQKRIEKHETLELVISDQIDGTKTLLKSLKMLPAETWDDVPVNLMKQYPVALRALADFIESE